MRRSLLGLALVLCACTEAEPPGRAALMIPSVEKTTPAVKPSPIVDERRLNLEPAEDEPHIHEHPLEGMSAEFPWGKGKDGNWPGTGATDPKELQAVSDAEMMKRAMGDTAERIDHEHALVSVGRRHLPGAIEAFRKAMNHEAPREVREMALSGLIEHGGKDALPLMWLMLRDDPSAQLRGQAVWAIALYGEEEARKAIDVGLSDEDIGVRGMAVLAVWALKDRPEEALSLLEAAAESDEQLIFQEAFYNLSRMPWVRAGRTLSRWALRAQEKKQQAALYYYRVWVRKFPDLQQEMRKGAPSPGR